MSAASAALRCAVQGFAPLRRRLGSNCCGVSQIRRSVVEPYYGDFPLWADERNGIPQPKKLGPLHVPIVPMSVRVPVALSMLYMETLAEPEFVT